MPEATASSSSLRSFGRSAGAVAAGVLTVIVVSLAIDEVFHLIHVYPDWNEPMPQTGLNVLALSYRRAVAVLGGDITARLSPRTPMFHAMVTGGIGFVLSLLGVAAAIAMEAEPLWYPIALVVTAIPCTWLGAKLYKARA